MILENKGAYQYGGHGGDEEGSEESKEKGSKGKKEKRRFNINFEMYSKDAEEPIQQHMVLYNSSVDEDLTLNHQEILKDPASFNPKYPGK